ncbi:MAG: hypothetical protein LBS55_05695 [Prevotellaceae bacterium]|nr:hypothetical protein [Prevotellaceae bacterium]
MTTFSIKIQGIRNDGYYPVYICVNHKSKPAYIKTSFVISDSENAILAGDAFDFAKLHYKQQDDELLQTLNKELFLYIGQKRDFYASKKQRQIRANAF